jgi:hypothetical protein
MLDIPSNLPEKNPTEIEQIVADISKTRGIFDILFPPEPSVDVSDPLYIQAKKIVDSIGVTLHFHEVVNFIKESFNFVRTHQGLSLEEQKQDVIKLLDYIIDLTDTPYLPDDWSDPIFKMFVPSLVEIMGKALNGHLIPITSDEAPSPETFKEFIHKVKNTFGDGLHWNDLGVCIQDTILFIGGFPSLSTEAKKQSVVDILDTVVEIVEIPFIPTIVLDPIFKAIVPSLVDYLFDHVL